MIVREIDFAVDADIPLLGLRTLEYDAVDMIVQIDALHSAEKIEVPERAPEFAVGRKLHADVFLLLDHVLDFLVLYRLQLHRRDFALLSFRARLFQGIAAQKASDLVGAKRRF